jgi:ABC-type multidrug transport system fused ATPase/permease subunit
LLGIISDKHAPSHLWRGLFFCGLMFCSAFVQSMLSHQYMHRMFRIGMNIRSVLTAAIFTKSLQLSNAARKERTVGGIVNLMAVDTQRFQDITNFGMLFISAPLQVGSGVRIWAHPRYMQIILALTFLWQELGVSSLGGLAVMILIIPVNLFIAVRTKSLQAVQMRYKDERLKMMNEILNGMKVIKLYAWEPSMQKTVADIRQREIYILKRIAYWNALSTFTISSAPFLVAVASFSAYVLSSSDNILTPAVTFTSLALFNILRTPMNMLANLIGQTVQLIVSNRRIKDFLCSEELDAHIVNRIDRASPTMRTPAVSVVNGEFTWDQTAESTSTLRDMNINIGTGQLVAVVGQVGCGKSSLLSALLGEMHKVNGNVTVRGSVAYVPQQAWIQNLTLQVVIFEIICKIIPEQHHVRSSV